MSSKSAVAWAVALLFTACAVSFDFIARDVGALLLLVLPVVATVTRGGKKPCDAFSGQRADR